MFAGHPGGLSRAEVLAIYRPRTLIELAVAESLLEAHAIPYYVHNRGYGGLYPGMQIDLLNIQTILVPPSVADDAREMLHHYLQDEPGLVPNRETSLWHMLRMLVEAVFCAWFVPRVGGVKQESVTGQKP